MIQPYDPDVLWILIVSFIIAFILAFGVGANDVANSFGTSVGSRVLTLRKASILATIFEILGACLLGYQVSNTVRNNIADISQFEGAEKELMLGFLSALIGSATWNLIATLFSMPISGTHSIVGSVMGFAIVARGVDNINWPSLGKIASSWFISPLLSGAVSVALFVIIRKTILEAKNPTENALLSLPIFYGVTIFINVISVVIGGPALLGMDKLLWWHSMLISAGLGLLVALVVYFYAVPRLRVGLANKADPSQAVSYESSPADVETDSFKNPKVSIENPPQNEKKAFEDDPNSNAKVEVEKEKPDPNPEKVDISVDDQPSVASLFKYLQILTACFGSFAHGGNDVSNAIGPLIAVLSIYESGLAAQTGETPIWVLLFGGVGISTGLWLLGRRVIKTMGEDITRLTPTSGFSIEIGAASTVLAASKVGIPISTTHCKVGSVVMVGYVRSRESVRLKVFTSIIAAWLLTVPISALFSAASMIILQTLVPLPPRVYLHN